MADDTIAWEYYTVRVSAGFVHMGSIPDELIVTLDAELARLGQEGWELVSLLQEPSADNRFALLGVMKRRLKSDVLPVQ
jgi:hypothetical protein